MKNTFLKKDAPEKTIIFAFRSNNKRADNKNTLNEKSFNENFYVKNFNYINNLFTTIIIFHRY